MEEHAEIRELLTLAAAGALDEAGQRRVQEHLHQCSDCRAELAAWQRLTGALEALPTPQAPLGLVERTRRQMERRSAAQAEHRWNRTTLAWLTGFAWISTLLTWPLFQFFGGKLGEIFNLSPGKLNQVWIGYMVVSWMMSVVVAGLLGQRRQKEGRTQ
ncbi:MAG TPA: zf-HC2 domain-containing protein [Candidatus Angelobacter sp.]